MKDSEATRGEGGKGFALWGGRFQRGGLAPEAERLNRSLPIDRRLWREELEVAGAWVEALADAGAVEAGTAATVLRGLAAVGERLGGGAADEAPDEDIHTLVERLLSEEIGESAGVLRTGRSRNDQAATASRLWVMDAAGRVEQQLRRLQRALLTQAGMALDVLVPSYTHLQRAQPIRFAQFFLAHFWSVQRDCDRWLRVRRSASVMPLGAGAVAGSGFAVDREKLRARLGFETVTDNSLDAVSDRDFVAEFAFTAALTGAHLSRLAEDLILYASAEFRFVRFSERYSTGSSLMPQKRNPDVAELARGQGARLLGDCTAAVALLKGLPAGYNKDLQEDKGILFRAYDTLAVLLPAVSGSIETLTIDAEAARSALDSSLLAVDIADALVRSGVTFRDAHDVVGGLVRQAETSGLPLERLNHDQVVQIHPGLPEALKNVFDEGLDQAYVRSVEARSIPGGTARSAIETQIAAARATLSAVTGEEAVS